ncbi:hypothetical protein H1R20_g11153, partial [Candolleomyces eurysporus]
MTLGNNPTLPSLKTIPLAGTPIKGALEALHKVLQLIEARYQVQEDAKELLSRIASLVNELSRYNGQPILHVEKLARNLKEAFEGLERLMQKKRRLRYRVIAASIKQWNSQIDQCLMESVFMMNVEMSISRPRELTIESITVIDPFGFAQVFPKPQQVDLLFLSQWILGQYDGNPELLSLLKGFLDRSAFEITLDNGSKPITVQPELLPHLKDGTRLVMSVVTFQIASLQQTTVPCPSCGKDIPVQVSVDISAVDRVLCPYCDGRVQTETTAAEGSADDRGDVAQGLSKYIRNIIVKLLLDSSTLSQPPEKPIDGIGTDQSLLMSPMSGSSAESSQASGEELAGGSYLPVYTNSFDSDSIIAPREDTYYMNTSYTISNIARTVVTLGLDHKSSDRFGDRGSDLFMSPMSGSSAESSQSPGEKLPGGSNMSIFPNETEFSMNSTTFRNPATIKSTSTFNAGPVRLNVHYHFNVHNQPIQTGIGSMIRQSPQSLEDMHPEISSDATEFNCMNSGSVTTIQNYYNDRLSYDAPKVPSVSISKSNVYAGVVHNHFNLSGSLVTRT